MGKSLQLTSVVIDLWADVDEY